MSKQHPERFTFVLNSSWRTAVQILPRLLGALELYKCSMISPKAKQPLTRREIWQCQGCAINCFPCWTESCIRGSVVEGCPPFHFIYSVDKGSWFMHVQWCMFQLHATPLHMCEPATVIFDLENGLHMWFELLLQLLQIVSALNPIKYCCVYGFLHYGRCLSSFIISCLCCLCEASSRTDWWITLKCNDLLWSLKQFGGYVDRLCFDLSFVRVIRIW